MSFSPIELETCREHNFTIKALGPLVFRRDLRERFVRALLGPDALSPSDGDIAILFFHRLAEGFFREAVEREHELPPGELERQLNQLVGLPLDFRWARTKQGRLTQPASWNRDQIERMLVDNRRLNDHQLKNRLDYLQDCFNTEPDVILQWGRRLALIEIKVLSAEGENQLNRQVDLGRIIASLAGWQPFFYFIGPRHGGQPAHPSFKFVPWDEFAGWFSDVPEIVNHVRDFVLFYRGQWQSMTCTRAAKPGPTLFDLAFHMGGLAGAAPLTASFLAPVTQSSDADPWHFSHLGPAYFMDRVFEPCRRNGIWPLRWIWTGRSNGVPYAEKKNGRRVNPNWMVEDTRGQRRTNHNIISSHSYDERQMIRWEFSDVLSYFNLRP